MMQTLGRPDRTVAARPRRTPGIQTISPSATTTGHPSRSAAATRRSAKKRFTRLGWLPDEVMRSPALHARTSSEPSVGSHALHASCRPGTPCASRSCKLVTASGRKRHPPKMVSAATSSAALAPARTGRRRNSMTSRRCTASYPPDNGIRVPVRPSTLKRARRVVPRQSRTIPPASASDCQRSARAPGVPRGVGDATGHHASRPRLLYERGDGVGAGDTQGGRPPSQREHRLVEAGVRLPHGGEEIQPHAIAEVGAVAVGGIVDPREPHFLCEAQHVASGALEERTPHR